MISRHNKIFLLIALIIYFMLMIKVVSYYCVGTMIISTSYNIILQIKII